MAGLDPSIALAANAVLQSQVQALDLGIALEILQAQLSIGDILSATVLPPQGGSDRLSLLGLTVPAQLPPGIAPGETLSLVITGFAGNAILVQNLGPGDPQNPSPPATVTALVPRPAGAPSANLNAPAANSTTSASPPTGTPATPLAPPRAVFVAASVQPAPNPSSPAPPQAPPPSGPAAQPTAGGIPTARPAPSPAANPIPAGAGEPAGAAGSTLDLGAQLGLEARIVASRAAAADLAESILPGGAAQPAAVAPPNASGLPAVAARAPASLPPPIAPPPTPPPTIVRPAIAPRESAPPLAAEYAAEPLATEAALLARLRVPILPLTVRAAHLVATATASVPRVFARLDAALASLGERNGAATLRNALAFVTRLDPGNARALPEQLAAYVTDFLGGPEAKLAAAVRAFMSADASATATAAPALGARAAPAQPAAAPPNPAPASAPPNAASANAPSARLASPQAPLSSSAPPATAPAPPAASLAARIIDRTVALALDPKAAIAALIASPPRGAPPELTPALSDALATITALQLNALQAHVADPQNYTIPLPVFYREGGAPAQLRVRRDANNAAAVDRDNFSIAFVLDTSSLGIVAVDVQTVGRTVNVSVKTEGAGAAGRFRATLGDLRGRLETLRYRVASIAAAVAPHRGTAAEALAPDPLVDPRAATWKVDLRA